MSKNIEAFEGPKGEPGLRMGAAYEEVVDFACREAGGGSPGWNVRFREALRKCGLRLRETGWELQNRDGDYPAGIPYQAPAALEGDADGWPEGAVIVYDETALNTIHA